MYLFITTACLKVGDKDSKKQIQEDVVADEDPDNKIEAGGRTSSIHAIPHHVVPIGSSQDLKHLSFTQ